MPAGGSRFGTSTEGVASLLKTRTLKVPVHQRSYAWDEEQVSDYWADLLRALNASQDEYFLGSVVLTKPTDDERHTIIDGQQRLATTTILVAAIRDLLADRGDTETVGEIERTYLASKDLVSLASTPHLVLNAEDAGFFKQRVLDRDESAPATLKSHERIVATQAYFREKLAEYAPEAAVDARDKLIRWVSYLTDNATIIVVDVSDESDAFLIFETLNYRGVPLTVADLLKNYLFGLSGAQLEAMKRSWAAAASTLESYADPDLFVTFLRHLWVSENGIVRERDLYRSMKSKLRTGDQVVAFGSRLEEAARHYAALLSPDHEAWGELGVDARTDVESLLRLNIEQNRPLILSAMDKFKPVELKKLLRLLVSWTVRGLVVGGIGSGATETVYVNAAVRIREGKISAVAELFEALKDIIPSDERFRSSFAAFAPPTNKIARYYLIALESGERGEEEPELVPNENEEEVNLEHVLPRRPKDGEWDAFDDVEITEWSPRLGNVVLLRKTQNARLGNKGFEKKREVLKSSDLVLTKMVGALDEWTPQAIEERQARLADLALKVWPRS